MPDDDRNELRKIRTFPQLVRYLRDEMGWPIEQDSFEDDEDLYYDFTPEELGLDTTTAAKIEQIRRLKRLSANQPWGIFFVKFAPGRLPIIALRRILNQVVLKKRATAKAAERTAWAADDLLFVSNHGEGGERQISFAHFSQTETKHDLPTLKVLGWDNLDTPMHLDAVAEKLTANLAWPEDDTNIEAWRKRWRSAFELRHREVITTSHDLSIRLAELARAIRDRIKTALAHETERGPLTMLMNAFREALVHDLDANGFADMYAQTIAYGLLSARIADPHNKTADDFAAHMRTNPFLRELMETFLKVGGRRGKAGGPGIDFDELGVSEVIELLDDANMEAVVRDFGDRNPQEDPVIHFYELFLKEYDAKKRMRRGVFYTPRPVVSYIVRSVDELLRIEFGLADGLADTATWAEMAKRHEGVKIPEGVSPDQDFVQILDPATGTGTFLVEVIDLIHKTLVAKWRAQGHDEKQIDALWNEYVPRHLLKRLHGYELLMAPYAIVHLKIGLKLYETGYRFGSDERARVYLTNALEPAQDFSGRFEFAVPALAHEAQAVNAIKERRRFTVVIGNPPYSNFGQLNRIPFILDLLNDYKRGLDEKKINLDDDFIKFVRFSQHLIDVTGGGVVGMITNNSFFDGPTHRRMRQSLAESFGTLRAINLHGSLKKGETAPNGQKDENVFDITVGVGISILGKSPQPTGAASADLYGSRDAKYERLGGNRTMKSVPLRIAPPEYFFVPKDLSLADEYRSAPSIPDVFLSGISGIKTHRDGLLVDLSREALVERFRDIANNSSVTTLKQRYGVEDTAYWSLAKAKRHILERTVKTKVQRYFYRPFDYRYVFYEPEIIERGDARWSVMQHMLHYNCAFVCTRQTNPGDFTEILISNALVDKRALASFTGEARAYPLYLYDESLSFNLRQSEAGSSETRTKRPNLSTSFLKMLAAKLRLDQQDATGLPSGVTAQDILNYAYATLHSPAYRSRYTEFLRIDFPRLPMTGSVQLFHALARLGGELVALHLLESPKLDHPITEYLGGRAPEVEKVSWSNNTVWLDKAQTTGFKDVREDVWNFHIGGYQVCEKWLKDRKGRTLSKDDIAHYQKIVVALNETIRLMKEIDEVIEEHGGWPGAFQTVAEKSATSPVLAKVVPFNPRVVVPPPEDRYKTCVPLVPLKAAAGAFSDPQHVEDDGFDWVEIDSGHRLRPGMFVAQVVGKSMEPDIPDGSYCLFRAPVEGTRQGKTVLVQLRDAADPETGQRYTVKRYESEKVKEVDSWRHERITLKPTNHDFEPIVLEDAKEGAIQVIAEMIQVLEA